MNDQADNEGMPALRYVRARRGQHGRAVQPSTVRRMTAIVDEVSKHSTAITARHLFYLMVGRGLPKTELAYKILLVDLLKLRRSGDVAWEAVADGTRLKTKWVGFGNLAEAAELWQRQYRRDIWRMNSSTCEIWTESRGLLTTINEVAGEYGATTLGVGGFNSASVGYETAQTVKAAIDRGQDFYIFHFGDFDPAGKNIGASAEREIRWHLTDHEQDCFHFEVRALKREQVQRYGLPSAPVKVDKRTGKTLGGRAAEWNDADGTTELDALDPVILQGLVREAIESVMDEGLLDEVKVAEDSERDVLGRMISTMKGPTA